MFPLKKLEDICEVIAGQSPPSSSYNQNKDGLPFFQGKADFNEKYPSIRYWCTKPKKISEIDDILISVRAPVGSININNIKACIGRGLAAIRCGEKIKLDFLYHYLKYQENRIEDLGTGSTFKAITIKTLRSIKIPLPPLKTQQHIASILDDAAALRDKTKQLLEEYDNLAQSIFLDMFGDPVLNPLEFDCTKLDSLFEITSSKRIFKNEYTNTGIPFYRTKEIVELSKGKNISLELYISEERYEEIKSKFEIPKKGDILLSAVGTIGVMWVVENDSPFYFKDGNLLWLKTSNLNTLNKDYLIHILTHLIEFDKDKLSQGAAYNALTITKLKNFEIPVPSIELQNQFAEKIALIEQQKDLVKQELKESEDLFNCLLQKAFKGELIPESEVV